MVKKIYPVYWIIKAAFTAILWAVLTNACTSDRTLEEGRTLAQKHCSSCHLFPEPNLLTRSVWKDNVLPAMAEKIGIEVLEGNMYLHHKTSLLNSQEWSAIQAFYQGLAPDSLVDSSMRVRIAKKGLLTLKKPKISTEGKANTTLVAIDSGRNQLISGNAVKPVLDFWDSDFHKVRTLEMPSPAVAFLPGSNASDDIITCLGGMRASDATMGQVIQLDKKSVLHEHTNRLIRPIHTSRADFDQDGSDELLVCAFGHDRGGIYVLSQNKQSKPVLEIPGATQTIIRDLNGDQWPDFLALFAHGDEGIRAFINDRQGGFAQKSVLRFPPVYGSSSFQLADLDGDGREDILYTAGDNSDYSRILKPYHGIYIFKNEGNLTFRQTHFFPMHGCTKAVAADFDLDGDLDIAVIAFFANFKASSRQTFLLLENQRKPGQELSFVPASIPVGQSGRWICMDVNDLDGDGDPDIVLGNFSRGFLNQEQVNPDWDVTTPFVLLENNTRRANHRASSRQAAR